MPTVEELQRDIQNLRTAVPDLKGVLLASNEGRPIAYALADGIDANRLAALAAAASSLGKRVSDSLHVGTLAEISLSGSEGQVFLYNAGNKAVLAVIGPTGANTGLVHLEARWTAREIGDRMAEESVTA